MRRAARTVLVFLLMTAMFLVAASAVVVTVHAQDKPTFPVPNRKPIGPDELFAALPDITFEGTAPTQFAKAIVLRVPNAGSWHDDPALDLSSNDQVAAAALELTLDMHLEYRPWFYKESNRDRLLRYEPTLRNADVPRVGITDCVGKQYPAVDKALDTFAAEYVFLLNYVPGAKGEAGMAAAFRYRRGAGVQAALEWQFPKLGKPEQDTVVKDAEQKAINVIGQHGREDAEGKWQEYRFAPVPKLVASDSAMRDYAKVREAFYTGELATALIHYETLMAKDPACGRAALFGIEIHRGLSETQTGEEHFRYRDNAMRAGREALKHTPDDVILRAHLCWYGAIHYNRTAFGEAGLKQAMRAQPANVEVFNRWMAVYSIDDREAQVKWLIEHALPLVKDGRIEYAIATIHYGSGKYAEGVEWYEKAVALAPLEHEYQKVKGLCGTYLAESSWRAGKRNAAKDAWFDATDALALAQDIDPRELKWVYEYYVRVATHDFMFLPMGPAALDRLFLSQAVVNGLESTSRTPAWDKLVTPVIELMRRTLRETCDEAKPGDSLYEMKLMARLRFAVADEDSDKIVHTLWLMHQMGLRTEMYYDYMRAFGPIVKDYQPPEEPPKDPPKEE
jgi:tetratricopeptide (TPR) repeat protein